MIILPPPQTLTFNGAAAQYHLLQHNLPAGLYVVQILRSATAATALCVVPGSQLLIWLSDIDLSASYKLVALQLSGGALSEGVWWVDNYVYDSNQRNIEFKSQGQDSGTGELKTFTGQTLINQRPVSRRVVALGIDGDAPRFLAQAQSNQQGRYTLEWRGYTGQVLITATDDYGQPWAAGATMGVGERVHPTSPNGHVYQVSIAGELGATEPDWPTLGGSTVLSGTVQLVAHPYYQPKSAGPVTVV